MRIGLLPLSFAALALLVPSLAAAQEPPPVGVGGSVTIQIGTPGAPAAPPPAAPPVAAPPPAAPAPVYAPPPPPPRQRRAQVEGAFVHDGFYLRLGLGVGGFSANGTLTPDMYGGSVKISGAGMGLDLLLGGSISPGLVLGGGLIFQQIVKPDVSLPGGVTASSSNNGNFGVIGPFLQWYPNPRSGFHLSGMVGLAALTASNPETGESKAGDRGAGLALAGGYDFWVAPQWSIGLDARLFGGSVSKDFGDGSSEKYSVTGLTLSASAVLH